MSKVTVVGAGRYGSTTVQRLAEMDLVDEIVMTDIIEGLPQGLALDINESAPIEGFRTTVIGSNDYRPTAGSDVVVITAGKPRQPGMSRMDLLGDNAKIIASVVDGIVGNSPDAVLIVVTNPLDEMTALTQLLSGLPHERVMGQAGMLDTARFAFFVSSTLGVAHTDVKAITLGSHGETMVPVPSQVTVKGEPLPKVAEQAVIDRIVERTREGGAEIVGLLKTGSAYFAPSSAAAAMVRAIVAGSTEIVPVCAWLDGQYGIEGVYLGVPVRLGRRGVEEVVELSLTDQEVAALRAAGDAVRSKQADVQRYARR
jgi:malate dehydrogenase